jgi:hypothetical protein
MIISAASIVAFSCTVQWMIALSSQGLVCRVGSGAHVSAYGTLHQPGMFAASTWVVLVVR